MKEEDLVLFIDLRPTQKLPAVLYFALTQKSVNGGQNLAMFVFTGVLWIIVFFSLTIQITTKTSYSTQNRFTLIWPFLKHETWFGFPFPKR